MAELLYNAAKLLELGQAMSEYGQTLNASIRCIHQLIQEADAEISHEMNAAAGGVGGWGLDSNAQTYEQDRRRLIEQLDLLRSKAREYEAARDSLLHLMASSNGDDAQNAKTSLKRLAEALEGYYGVQLLEIGDDADDATQKVLVKKR